MATLTSNTIVKNGMPFIGLALKRALPYVDQMIVTISKKADKRTIEEVRGVAESDKKVEIYWEDVKDRSELTQVEQEQLENSKGDWIWTLEDDDIFPDEDLEKCMSHFGEDIDGISLGHFQVIDNQHYDSNRDEKSLTKFFKRKDAYWAIPFPRNMQFNKKSGVLYWKKNKRVKVVPYKYFHLVLLKEHSFRNEPEWVENYGYRNITPARIPEEYIEKLRVVLKP